MPTAKTKKSEGQYHEGLGRRKESVARVRITPAKKMDFSVNDKELHVYFPTEELQKIVRSPFALVEGVHYTVSIHTKGGGMHSQAEAVAMGLARALEMTDKTLRPVLKKGKLLTSNSRQKERRKFGLKKARKAPQWSKR
ncbi:MAG: 30S ribosomal protein S9 [Candidatus Paceibacterota bacterium]|jgi:small subunit ribosomal protein S9